MKELTVLRLGNKMEDYQQNGASGKTEVMGSFGENLRREREMRGVTLEEISAATKISIRFLKSIENEEFSSLPGGIFSRSFVRAYAHYLGLDEDPLLEEYQLAAKARAETDLSHFSPPRVYSRPEVHSKRGLWAVVIAVSLLVMGLTLWRHSHQTLQVPPPAKTSSTVRPAPAAAAPPRQASSDPSGNTQPASPKPAGGGVLAATSPMATAPKLPAVTNTDGKLVLQVAATEPSWVAVDADGHSVIQGVMDPNTVKTFKADSSFDVLTGNAQGVILTLNGHTIKPLGREGEVKQVHLTWQSLKQKTSE